MEIQEKYLKSQIESSDPLTLVVLLYEGAIRFLGQGKAAIEEKNYELSSERITRARNIVTELMCSLNMNEGGDLANRLMTLYVFIYEQLVHANIYKQVDYIDNAVELLSGLLEAWRQLAEQAKPESTASFPDTDEIPSPPPMAHNDPVQAYTQSAGIDFSG